ncbi:MAG TPA: right-handed parallel beta-helix repeat-containing protein, partial [Spirochaetota bacterium]|nr:right-handed parallel beta-helix repeat-containing protein [Spirochaetota bacterium]
MKRLCKRFHYWFGFFIILTLYIFPYHEEYTNTVNNFMGANVGYDLQMYHYHYNDNPNLNVAHPFRWVRIYHKWEWYEMTNDIYIWDDSVSSWWWKWNDAMLQSLDADGVNSLLCVEFGPDWLGGIGNKLRPCDSGMGSNENNYRERAEYLAQLAIRYGRKSDHPAGNIETSDKVQGLDLIRYIEDFNEQDQWWNPYPSNWPPELYGKYLNAAHDGFNVTTDSSLPAAGIKNGDPDMVHVMGGTACAISNPNGENNYTPRAVAASGRGTNSYDVLNTHFYWTTNDSMGRDRGASPEWGLIDHPDNDLQRLIDWRDANAPGKEIWVTEFGWDTGSNQANGLYSKYYADFKDQADYLMRGFALFRYFGVAKAFMFMLTEQYYYDTASQYSTCGVIMGHWNSGTNHFGWKRSYYYLTTMRRTIGEYQFAGADLHAYNTNGTEIYKYRFQRPSNPDDEVLMLWCREKDAPYNNGTYISNYDVTEDYLTNCTMITPAYGKLSGNTTNLTIPAPGSNAVVTVPALTETPVFLKLNNNIIIPDEYHVALWGSDATGTGTSNRPFRTITRAMASVGPDQMAFPGDFYIYVHPGIYTREVLLINQLAAAGNHILITSYDDNDKAVIKAEMNEYNAADCTIKGDNIILSNLAFAGTGVGGSGKAVFLREASAGGKECTNNLITHCIITNYDRWGIDFGYGGCSNAAVRSCVIADCNDSGVMIGAPDITVANCTIASNGKFGISAWQAADRITLKNNNISHNQWHGVDISSALTTAQDSIIISNRIHDNDRHGIFVDFNADLKIYRNLVINNLWDNIRLNYGSANEIYNNTIAASAANGIAWQNSAGGS